MNLLAEIKTLYLMILGLGLLIGFVSKSKIVRVLMRMLCASILILIIREYAQALFQQWSLLERVVVLLLACIVVPIGLLVGTRFGREVGAGLTSNYLYEKISRKHIAGMLGVFVVSVMMLMMPGTGWVLLFSAVVLLVGSFVALRARRHTREAHSRPENASEALGADQVATSGGPPANLPLLDGPPAFGGVVPELSLLGEPASVGAEAGGTPSSPSAWAYGMDSTLRSGGGIRYI